MAELLIRPGVDDAQILERLLGDRSPQLARLRVVADAHAVARTELITEAASRAGAPLIIDPQTYYLQDTQDPIDPWCSLPFAHASTLTVHDLAPRGLEALIESVIQFEVAHGATSIVPPYFFLGKSEVGWEDTQASVWRLTRTVLDRLGVTLPVIPFLCVDWNRLAGRSVLHPEGPIIAALRILQPDEIALASSKSHLGARPHERLLDLCAAVTRLGRIAPVIAWQQGLLGEACVAAGAVGYETGVGRREALDMGSTLAARRAFSRKGPRAARGVYVRPLMRSIPKKSLEALSDVPTMWPSIFCLDHECCAPNGQTMLRDARAHTVRARRRSLEEITSVGRQNWRWGAIADKARIGLALAERINRRQIAAEIDTSALLGMQSLGEDLRRGNGQIYVA